MLLHDFINKLHSVTSSSFKEAVSRNVATEALKLIDEAFITESDPYGEPWAPLKTRNGRILFDTGALRGSFSAYPSGDGVKIVSSSDYAAAQQYGTKELRISKRAKSFSGKAKEHQLIPPRRMVPEGKRGIPQSYKNIIGDFFRIFVRQAIS